jgi:Tfp pilus assembly protein PilO
MNRIVRFLLFRMKSIRQKSRLSPLASVGLFAILLLILAVFISRFVTSYSFGKEREADLLKKQLDYRFTLLRHRDRLEKDLENFANNWAFLKSKMFLDGSDDLAFSNIQRSIEEIARTRNVMINSFKFEVAKRAGEVIVLPVSLDFSVRFSVLISFLSGLENAKNYLRISDLDVTSLYGGEIMNIRITVEGYRYEEHKNQ